MKALFSFLVFCRLAYLLIPRPSAGWSAKRERISSI
jgi:hypothetical protein